MSTARCIVGLIICLVLFSCRKTSIIGRWKQLDTEYYDSIFYGQKHERVWTFAKDSSFTINDGSDRNKDTTSDVPGWSTAGIFSGTWRMPDKKHLELRLDPKEPVMILRYEIIKLTDKELELIFPGWKETSDGKPMRYSRL
jgi:hypothetical protein